MKRIASLFLTFTLIFSLSVPAAGADDATGTTLRLEETEGSVTVRTSAGTQKSIIKSMRLYNGYTVTTGASSSAFISLDDTKAVKLDASSKVSIKKSGKKLEISLSSGQIFFNVTRPLATDESFSIRTSTMVTGIRGSFGWVTPEKVGLMHGRVIVTSQIVATGSTQTVELTSGEQVTAQQMTATPGSEPTLVKEPITNEDVPAIVVEEVAKDETLQSQLEEDVPGIDVTGLVESLPEKQAEEAAKEQEVQKQVEEAVTQQAETIAASEADTANGGDSGTDYYFADTSETSDSQGSTDTTGSGNTGSTTYSPGISSTVTRTVTVVTTGSNLVVYSPNLAGNKTKF